MMTSSALDVVHICRIIAPTELVKSDEQTLYTFCTRRMRCTSLYYNISLVLLLLLLCTRAFGCMRTVSDSCVCTYTSIRCLQRSWAEEKRVYTLVYSPSCRRTTRARDDNGPSSKGLFALLLLFTCRAHAIALHTRYGRAYMCDNNVCGYTCVCVYARTRVNLHRAFFFHAPVGTRRAEYVVVDAITLCLTDGRSNSISVFSLVRLRRWRVDAKIP